MVNNGERVSRLLAHWRDTLCPDLRGKLDSDDRLRVVLARIADGFTEEDLKCAIDAAKVSPWHQATGQEHRLRISVLFGKSEMVADLVARGRAIVQRAPARAATSRASPPKTVFACTAAENAASGRRVLAALARCSTATPTNIAERRVS